MLHLTFLCYCFLRAANYLLSQFISIVTIANAVVASDVVAIVNIIASNKVQMASK